MSVYTTAKSPYWQFDFVIDGTRFHGSTGQTTRRAAEAVERTKRLEAGTGQLGKVAKMTLNDAAGQWWRERGFRRGDAADIERRIGVVLRLVGPARLLGDIDQTVISDAIERRRGETFTKSNKPGAKQRPVSDSTVNRDIIETLRPILRRARTHWTPKNKPHGLPEIDWTELHLSEPTGLSRLYSRAELAAWREACPDDLLLALDMILVYGLRLGELLFPPSAFKADAEEPALDLQKGRKRDTILHVPITRQHGRELAARCARAIAAELDSVWYYQEGEKLRAYTYAQIEYRLSKAADAAGIDGGRRIHGGRHHAGSTVMKRTGNLKAVQGLLGHASINSSQRYAHIQTSDLRAMLEADAEQSGNTVRDYSGESPPTPGDHSPSVPVSGTAPRKG